MDPLEKTRGTFQAARRFGFFTAVALLLSVQFSFAQGGSPTPFAQFTGARKPYSAMTFVNVRTADPNEPFRVGWFLDTDGNRSADVAEVTNRFGRNLGPRYENTWAVSPSDPSNLYVMVWPGYNNPRGGGVDDYFVTRVVQTGASVTESGPKITLPTSFTTFPGGALQQGLGTQPWTNPKDGSDVVLVFAFDFIDGTPNHASSRIAVLTHTPGAPGKFADRFVGSVTLPYIYILGVDGQGNAYGWHARTDPADARDYLVLIRDSNADQLPDTVDRSAFPSTYPEADFAKFGSMYDRGTDRLWLRLTLNHVDPFDYYDLNGFQKGGPGRRFRWPLVPFNGEDVPCYGTNNYPEDAASLTHDGYPIYRGENSCQDWPAHPRYPVVVWDDPNFDKRSTQGPTFELPEALVVFHELQLMDDTDSVSGRYGTIGVPDLLELRTDQGDWTGNWAEVVFAEHGEISAGESFRFRFGGQSYDRLHVSKNGLVSFAGPFSTAASLDGLRSAEAAIAPAWSDEWDTSKVRVHVGYGPVQKSFVTGQRVLAFVVEWRGLYYQGKRTSMRLMMLSDGSFRTDYGAVEVGTMSLTVGYKGPGLQGIVGEADASAHSWGSTPAGSGNEQSLGQQFGSGGPADVDRLWVRWAGYPEQRVAGDQPVIVNPRIKNGVKLVMDVAGSRIKTGAVVIVDGTERFTLTKTKNGTGWQVKKNARSTPGNRTVAELFASGSHTIMVENPDGLRSAPSTLSR